MNRPPILRRIAGCAAVLTVGLLMSGCSSDDGDTNDKAKEQPSAEQSVDPAKVSPTDLPEVPALRKPQGAVADVAFGDCAAEQGEQSVSATVTNSTKAATDYVVTVSWVNASSDVLARAVATVPGLAPDAEKTVELSAEVPAAATQCTFHVQRGALR